MATPSIAANAYASLAKLTDPSGLTKGAGEVSGGPSFGNLVKDAINSLSKSTHNSDLQTHAAANGNVKYPNVNSLVEMTDLREAQRSYEANINVIGASRRMIQRTIEILKS